MKSLRRTILFLTLPSLLGMGNLSLRSEEVPIPEEAFKVKVTDQLGITTEVEHASCEGKTYIVVERGKAKIQVPFSKIEKVTAIPSELEVKDRVELRFILKQGSTLFGSGSAQEECQGLTEFGSYSIRLKDIRSIEFLSQQRTPPTNPQ